MMKHRKKMMAAFVILTVGVGGGMAMASQGQRHPDDLSAPPSPPAESGVRDVTEHKFVPLGACRVLDTGEAGQPVPGQDQPLVVRGSGGGFAGQGGKPGGCAVPASASAVALTVTVRGADGQGTMRVNPISSAAHEVLGFGPGGTHVNSATVTLCEGLCLADLLYRLDGASGHVAVDVHGYFVPPLAATLRPDGSMALASRAVSSEKVGTGSYLVRFDRDVSRCVVLATTRAAATMVSGSTTVTPDRVVVRSYDHAGNLVDRWVSVEVIC